MTRYRRIGSLWSQGLCICFVLIPLIWNHGLNGCMNKETRHPSGFVGTVSSCVWMWRLRVAFSPNSYLSDYAGDTSLWGTSFPSGSLGFDMERKAKPLFSIHWDFLNIIIPLGFWLYTILHFLTFSYLSLNATVNPSLNSSLANQLVPCLTLCDKRITKTPFSPHLSKLSNKILGMTKDTREFFTRGA